MSPSNRIHDDLVIREELVAKGVGTNPDDMIRLLEAMAQGTDHQKNGQSIILDAAANMLRAYHQIAVDLA